MIKGGYQIIDLKGIELSGDTYYMSGIYSKIEHNHDKTILMSNINIDGDINDYYVQPVYDDEYNLIMTVGEHTLYVTPDDDVYIVEGIVGGSSGSSYSAGNGVSINNNTISVKAGSNLSFSANGSLNATDTTYTAGDGISISEENVISATGGGGHTYSEGVGIDITSDVISAEFMKINLFIDDTSPAWTDVKDMSVGDTVYASSSSEVTCDFDPTPISDIPGNYPFIISLNSGTHLTYDEIGIVMFPLFPTNSGSMVFGNQVPVFVNIHGSGGWSGLVLLAVSIEYDATNMVWDVTDLTIKRIL